MNYNPDVIKIEDSDDEDDQKCMELRSVNGTSFQEITLLEPERSKKPKTTIDCSDPKYLKPFQYGWQRELVYRATINDLLRINADVYYITPTRTRTRSMREVSEYLKHKKIHYLTVDNFTFVRVSLGVDDSNLEIIRTAKKITNRQKTIRKKCPECEPPSKTITTLPKITTQTNQKPVKYFRAITDPELRKPFLYNWKREVIFRTRDDASNRRVDANYITPKGQRVKTVKEIANYLKTTNCKDLTTSNFTFCSGPLGLNDPTKEIIIKAYLYEANTKAIQNVPAPPLQDPKLLKPFLYRWRRELVYRLNSANDKKHADAYYYAPTGEKLRSMNEIAQYLAKTKCMELTVENFNFFRRPLGVNDPDKETIRTALRKYALRKLIAKRKSESAMQTKLKRKYTKRKDT